MPKKLWRTANEYLNLNKTNSQNNVKGIHINGTCLTDSTCISTTYNYFSTTVEKLAINITNTNNIKIDLKYNKNSFLLFPMDKKELIDIINGFSNNITSGYDDIKMKTI